MQQERHLTRVAVLAAAGLFLAVGPAMTPAAAQVARQASSAASTITPPAASPAPAAAPACDVDPDLARFVHPLSRTARALAAGKPLRIVAVGSSSTAGAGASTSAASYPARLEVELERRFRTRNITVLNRGINGEEVTDMVGRFESAVIAERPDLVIWQVGTNTVLRDHPLQPHMSVLHGGIAALKAAGADIVLIDPQFAPRVIVKANAKDMVGQIAQTAKEEAVDLFPRFDVMRRWLKDDGLTFDTVLSPDQLHMNDWSYACLAKWLAASIAEAATRPTETARAPKAMPK
jgi:lysophospholipase L1-like esterase